MNKVLIQTKYRGFRPYSVDGKELKNIKFFYEGNVVWEVGRGWLKTSEKNRSIDLTGVYLNSYPIRKLKHDLFSEVPFYINEKVNKYGYEEKEICLYIPLKSPIKDLGLVESNRTDAEVFYHRYFQIDIEGITDNGNVNKIIVYSYNDLIEKTNNYDKYQRIKEKLNQCLKTDLKGSYDDEKITEFLKYFKEI